MKTPENERNIIIAVILMVLLAILMFILGKSEKAANAAGFSAPNKSVELQYERQNSQYLTEMIHAYNVVLHRVWIDRPEYVEDALCESPEYIRLEQFIGPDTYKEIFSFYDEEDSIAYHTNWNNHEGEPITYKAPLE